MKNGQDLGKKDILKTQTKQIKFDKAKCEKKVDQWIEKMLQNNENNFKYKEEKQEWNYKPRYLFAGLGSNKIQSKKKEENQVTTPSQELLKRKLTGIKRKANRIENRESESESDEENESRSKIKSKKK